MSLHRNLARQIARSQHFEPSAQLLDDAQLQQPAWIELVTLQLLQAPYIHDRVFFPEYVGEAAFRQTPVQRHLAAFKPAHDAIARNGFRALRTAARIFAAARAHTLSDTLLLLLLPSRRLQITQIHN